MNNINKNKNKLNRPFSKQCTCSLTKLKHTLQTTFSFFISPLPKHQQRVTTCISGAEWKTGINRNEDTAGLLLLSAIALPQPGAPGSSGDRWRSPHLPNVYCTCRWRFLFWIFHFYFPGSLCDINTGSLKPFPVQLELLWHPPSLSPPSPLPFNTVNTVPSPSALAYSCLPILLHLQSCHSNRISLPIPLQRQGEPKLCGLNWVGLKLSSRGMLSKWHHPPQA
jgi:hypothetical protein